MADPDSPSVPVTPEEFATAATIWIRTAPKRIWRDYWQASETAGKWDAALEPMRRFDPHRALGEHLAEKLRQAGWEIRQPERLGPHGPPRNAAPRAPE